MVCFHLCGDCAAVVATLVQQSAESDEPSAVAVSALPISLGETATQIPLTVTRRQRPGAGCSVAVGHTHDAFCAAG